MKSFFRLFAVGLLATSSATSSHSAQIYYDSEVQLYVRGGIMHGSLDEKEMAVTITPRVLGENIGMRVALNAQDNSTGMVAKFADIICSPVASNLVMPVGMTVSYRVDSCILTNSNSQVVKSITVPSNAKITASTYGQYPTVNNLRGITTPLRTFYVQSRPNWNNCEDAKNEHFDPVPEKSRKSLDVHVYLIPSNLSGGFIRNKKLCLSVMPRGADVSDLAASGVLYSNIGNREIFLDTFLLKDEPKNIPSKVGQMITKFDMDNGGPNLAPLGLDVGGKLTVKLTFKFSTVDTPQTFEKANQPILPYPPPNLPQ